MFFDKSSGKINFFFIFGNNDGYRGKHYGSMQNNVYKDAQFVHYIRYINIVTR